MKSARLGWQGLLLAWAVAHVPVVAQQTEKPAAYTVVVSRQTGADAEWKTVVDTLLAKHHGRLLAVSNSIQEALPALRAQFPRSLCFVARPEEVTREYVREAHRLARQLDEDPYADCFWGILTEYDAANALRIARQTEPLTVRKVAAGTELAMDMVEEGVWYCELPHRIRDPRVIEGAELAPLITDDFILVPNPGLCDPAKAYRLKFIAKARRQE